MRIARRSFLRVLAGVASVVFGGSQLAGCLGYDSSGKQSSSRRARALPTRRRRSPPRARRQITRRPEARPSSAPVWDTSTTIDFVEGVPAVISVREFVRDPAQDPVVITLKSGKLIPGITWNPNNASLSYDGRPLGAKPGAPMILTDFSFTADDLKH